jgi:hypothetical protein
MHILRKKNNIIIKEKMILNYIYFLENF